MATTIEIPEIRNLQTEWVNDSLLRIWNPRIHKFGHCPKAEITVQDGNIVKVILFERMFGKDVCTEVDYSDGPFPVTDFQFLRELGELLKDIF